MSLIKKGQTSSLNRIFPEFFSVALKKLKARANIMFFGVKTIGTCRDRPCIKNNAFPEFFSEALKKTQGSCKLNLQWSSSLKHEPGTDLPFI